MTELHQYKATGIIRFSVSGIMEENIEDAKKRFEEDWMLEGELNAAREHGVFEVDSLQIEDLGPENEKAPDAETSHKDSAGAEQKA